MDGEKFERLHVEIEAAAHALRAKAAELSLGVRLVHHKA